MPGLAAQARSWLLVLQPSNLLAFELSGHETHARDAQSAHVHELDAGCVALDTADGIAQPRLGSVANSHGQRRGGGSGKAALYHRVLVSPSSL